MSEVEVELRSQLRPPPGHAETTLDDLLPKLRGERGRFHACLIVFGLCVIIPACMCSSLPIFILTIPDHRCALPGWPNDSYSVQNYHHRQLINASIPLEGNGKMSSCTIFSDNDVNGSSSDVRLEVPCQRWVYDKTLFDRSLVEELGLVCDRKYIRTVANMMVYAGKVLSSPVCGVIGDRFGRKVVIISSAIALTIAAWSTVFIRNIPSLYILRFLAGAGTSPMYISAFVLLIEFQESKYRRRYSCLIYILWCIGIFIMIPLAYYVNNYWYLSIAIGSIATLFSSCAYFVPESPRWLLSKGRISEARAVLLYMARVNRVPFPTDVFDAVASSLHSFDQGQKAIKKQKEGDDITKCQDSLTNVKNHSSEDAYKTMVTKVEIGSFVQLFKHKSLLICFFILIWNWCTFTLVYTALMYNLSNLDGSLYLNFGLFNIVEIIGISLAYLTMDRMGRSLSYLTLLMVSTAACLASVLPVYMASAGVSEIVINVLSLVGRLGNAGSLTIFYLYSSELVPTPMRNIALSLCATCSRIVGVLGPFVADLGLLLGGQFQAAFPLIVCGAMGVFAFVSALTLPETTGSPLPDTVEEAIRQKQNKRKKCCTQRWISRQRSGALNV